MTVLITGVTGLVGERLVPRLVAAGIDCRVLVRTGKQVPNGVTSVIGDILDASTLPNAIRDVTAIVHLAAVFRTRDDDLIWRSNLDGTRNLIAAAEANVPNARFILSSTSHVYNSNNSHPGVEDDAVEPVLAYPASKVAAERALRDSALNWSILRFPFVYGDGDGHLEALPHHIAEWHPARKMSTIHHRDIATAILLALSGKLDGRIVNIADEAPLSVYELASLGGVKLASNSEPLVHPWHLHVDSSLARSLGFRPTVRTVFQAQQEGLL